MAVRGNSIIKGVEISEVITLLNKAYADEWLHIISTSSKQRLSKGS